MKKKVPIFIALACLLIAGTFVISAYLTDGDKADNELIIGSNRIEIVEEFDPPSEIIPGLEIKKDVKVKNTGSGDCYVRVKAVFDNSHMEQYCEIDWKDSDWIYNSTDGYWYYPNAIVSNEITRSLMTTVKIKETTPESVITPFDIIVYAESVETLNGADAVDYDQAWEIYRENKVD